MSDAWKYFKKKQIDEPTKQVEPRPPAPHVPKPKTTPTPKPRRTTTSKPTPVPPSTPSGLKRYEKQPEIVTSQRMRSEIGRQMVQDFSTLKGQYQRIDTGSKYKLESGEIVSGAVLRQRMRAEASPYFAGAMSTILKSTRNDPRRKYVKTDVGYYPLSGEQEFIHRKSSPETQKKIVRSYEPTPTELLLAGGKPIETSFYKGFEKLSPKEKEQYGYKFTDWSKVPVADIKFMPGGQKYLSSVTPERKERLIKEYRKDFSPSGVLKAEATYKGEPIPYFFQRTSMIKKDTSMTIKEAESELFWREITKKDASREWFEKAPPFVQAGVTIKEGVVGGLLTIPTLAQTGVKLATGRSKPLFLPDIGYEFSKSDVAPADVVGTSMAGVWFGQDIPKETREFQQKYLGLSFLKSGASLLGAVTSFAGVGIGVRGVSPYVKSGFRYGYDVSGLQTQKALDFISRVKGTYPVTQAGRYQALNLDLRVAGSVLRQPGMKTAVRAFTGIEKYGTVRLPPWASGTTLTESGGVILSRPVLPKYGFRFPRIGKGSMRGPDTTGYLSRYQEGVTTLEQLAGKRPDPFMSYRPSGVWGGYETSWPFYRQTLTDPVYGVVGTKAIPKTGTIGTEFTTPKIKVDVTPKSGMSGLKYHPPSERIGLPTGTLDYGYTPKGGGIGVTRGLSRLDQVLVEPTKVRFTTGGVKTVGRYTARDLELIKSLEYGTQTPSKYWTGVRPGGQLFEQVPMLRTGTGKLGGLSGGELGVVKPFLGVSVAPPLIVTISKPIQGMFFGQKPLSLQQQLPSFDLVQLQRQELGLASLQSLESASVVSTAQLQGSQQQIIHKPFLLQKTQMKEFDGPVIEGFDPFEPIRGYTYESPPPPRITIPFKKRGLVDLSGQTDRGFGFTTPIYRKRKYRVENILGELEKGFGL